MKRKIIEIDKDKCNGCGACAKACHEKAIQMINGKATLVRDDYCDGLGDCLPACPTDAISFVVREAAAYDEAAVIENKRKLEAEENAKPKVHVCPGLAAKRLNNPGCDYNGDIPSVQSVSRLAQWPVQIKLAPTNAPYFNKANLLIAADCTAYAYAAFHEKFMKGHVTLIGCPKLDSIDYSEKLTEILINNEITNIDVVRMQVPCCGGIELAVKKAIANSNKDIPCHITTLSLDGQIL